MIAPFLRDLLRRRLGGALFVLEVALGVSVAAQSFRLSAEYARRNEPASGRVDDGSLLVVASELELGDFDSAAFRANVVRGDREALRKMEGFVAMAEANEIAMNLTHLERLRPEPAARDGASATACVLDDGGDLSEVMGLELVAGRSLSRSDAEAAEGEAVPAVVTEVLAARLFGDAPALGRLVRQSHRAAPLRVVGVVRSFRALAGRLPDAESVLIVPLRPWLGRTLRYVVRVAPSARVKAAPAIREALAARPLARAVDAYPLAEGDARAAQTNAGARIFALVISGLVLLVVLLGRAGMSSFAVAERRQEIGLLRALGATRGTIARWFFAENAALTGIGLVVGVGLTSLLGLLARKRVPDMLLGDDVVALLVAGAVMLCAGMVSSVVPALRAARVPPTEASKP